MTKPFTFAVECLNEIDKILARASSGGPRSKPSIADLNRIWELTRNARTQLQARAAQDAQGEIANG